MLCDMFCIFFDHHNGQPLSRDEKLVTLYKSHERSPSRDRIIAELNKEMRCVETRVVRKKQWWCGTLAVLEVIVSEFR
jgi:hypothetical protein